MVRLFKKVYDSHVAETIALEPHSNYLSLRMLTNLKFTQGNVHPAGYFVQKMAKVSCMLEAGWSITGTGNGNQQVSLSENRLVGLCIPDAGQVHLVPS